MEGWVLAAVANMVIMVVYIAISVKILSPLIRNREWTTNPLATATGLIFFTCAVHHGSHPIHMMLPVVGLEEDIGLSMRDAFDAWEIGLWDVITAGVGIWYWTLRGRFPALVRGSALFEDIKARQKDALNIHDNIVQGLATAKLSLETGHHEEGLRSIEKTLDASRKIITELLGEKGSEVAFGKGDFRRARPVD